MKKIVFSLVVAIAIIISGLFTSCNEETVKKLNGSERTAVLMDYNGDTIKTWKGDFYIHECDGIVSFNLDGKRTTISGGIFVSEEQ